MEVAIVAPFIVFSTLFGIVYIVVSTRHKERMALLEQGIDYTLPKPKHRNNAQNLKHGMLAMGIGIGMIMGYVLESETRIDPDVAYFAMSFFFGGVALVAYYLIYHLVIRKQEQKEAEEDFPMNF